ncbi:MAG: fused MFS/spermidine synthase [Planctomycetota bacterium]|jgi:spermidine synthase
MDRKTKAEINNRPPLTGANRTGVSWIMLIYFCSGLCSLIDEVVWVRLLKLTLGNTVYASSIVVSMFMGGLALGALIMARFADRVKRRLRLYAILEVCATVSALSLPFLLRAADVVYRWFYLKYQPSPAALMFVQVIVSACILLAPAMVMGSTLPLLGRYVTALQDRVGRLVGRLYALNTLGAALGCFLAGFVLIRLTGVMGALYIAAGINLLVAFGGWMLSRSYDPADEPAAKAVPPVQPAVGTEKTRLAAGSLLPLAFFFSGLISIGYEIIWMRSIVFLLGGFTFVFSAVLTVYLVGNVVGAWIGSRLSSRLKHPAAGFGVSLTCLGILGIFYIPLLGMWLKTAPHIPFPFFNEWSKSVDFFWTILPLYHCVVLFLLPAIAMGIGFPLALQAWSNRRHKVGQTTGTVYAANTIGAVLGGIVAGFVLIPSIGAQLSITVLGLVAIWLGMVMVQVFVPGLQITQRAGYAIIAVAFTFFAVQTPSDLFVKNVVSTSGQSGTRAILAVREGITTTVSVKRNERGSLELVSGRVAIAGDGILRSAQTTLGHLGPFLNHNAADVLSIGFGGGETTACLATHEFERIDCVEIAPELVEVALKYFAHINLGEQLSEKVNMIYMDGKNYLHLTPQKYDIIVSGADIPSYSGSAPMFAREHFQNGLKHLKPGGIFMTKLHIGSIPRSSFDSILGTFMEVFPYVTIWFPVTKPYSFFYIIGSSQQQLFSPKHIEDELGKEGVRKSAEYLSFNNSLDVLSGYIGDKNDIRRYLKDFYINSDYTPYVELNLNQWNLIRREFFTHFIDIVRSDSIINHIDWTGLSQPEQEQWLKDYQLYYKTVTYVMKSHGKTDFSAQLQNSADGQKLIPGYAPLIEQENMVLADFQRILSRPETDLSKVITTIDGLLQNRPDLGTAWLIKSWALLRKNEVSKALVAAEKAAQYCPRNAIAQDNLGIILLKLGQTDKAITHYKKAVSLSPTVAFLHYKLAVVFLQQANLEEAVTSFNETVRAKPDWAEPINNLAWLVATRKQAEFYNPQRAVRLAQKACELTNYKKAGFLDTLSVAYAAAGKFDEAVTTAEKALEIALSSEQTKLAEEIRKHLSLYKAGEPYVEP